MKLRLTCVLLIAGAAFAQGPRGGQPPQQPPTNPNPQPPPTQPTTQPGPLAGQPLAGLTAAQLALFLDGKEAFEETDGVAEGLGPRFNFDGCQGCHSHPASGGTSPAVNPQIAVATKMGATNRIPPFLQQNGPVRVVRFRRNPDGSPDGGVHNLFVTTGRGDAPRTCTIQQPDFTNTNNMVFRIPTPVFGMGLLEAIPDATLRASLNATAALRRTLGINGRFNTNGNDGTITRFGWKAQNKSALIFAGEAYNVEVGVTNELFPQEREEDPNCSTTASVEDAIDPITGDHSDALLFSYFMKFLAPPRAAAATVATQRGAATFENIGCAACHTVSLRTGRNTIAALSNQDVRVYSDLALHRMGDNLNDGVDQGAANGPDWRTAPLWGVGQRLFFMHDGRSRDLVDAIRQHDGPNSEASRVIGNFNALSPDQRQDLIDFLRSL